MKSCLLISTHFVLAQLAASQPTYKAYGTGAAADKATHEQAVVDYIAITKTLTDHDFSPFNVIVYDPTTMTDDEFTAAIKFACDNSGLCPSAEEVRRGEFCSGCCGSPPIMVFKADSRDAAGIQEEAVHETTHILQIQNGAPQHTSGSDNDETWLCSGPRWWGEGTAMWMGDRVMRAYPAKYPGLDPNRQNMCRAFSEACSSYKAVAAARDLRLTDAIQASDTNWQKVQAMYQGEVCGEAMETSAYYPMVYEGGYCATNFILASTGLNTENTEGMKQGITLLETVMIDAKKKDDWEAAFLGVFTNFTSMQDLYEKFESAKGVSGYVYVAPTTFAPLDPSSDGGDRSNNLGFTALLVAACMATNYV